MSIMSHRPILITFVLVAIAWQQQSLLVAGHVHFKKGAPHAQLANGGLVSGAVKFSRDGRPYSSFVGIPYATAPERFQEPQPITTPSWEGVLSATKPGPICPQMAFDDTGGQSLGDENCLSLNVYVPMNNTGNAKRGYPVMVWLHGGAFIVSAGSGYGPQFIMDEDVILITINYRLGIFGFLSMADNVIPGNNGLKDMVVALQWVQENIKAFGGDPTSVTVFGESAGGAAVHYLLLSPTTKGLIHRAISQSGSALNQWAYTPNPKEAAVDLATHLNCQTAAPEPSGITSEEILACFKGLTTEELNKAQFSFKQSWPANLRQFYFGPTTEPSDPISNLTPFLSESPISMLSRKDSILPDIPWMVGVTEDENAVMFAGLVLTVPGLLDEMNADWKKVASSCFDYRKYISKEEQDQLSEKIKQFYFGDKQISEETRVALRNMFGDEMIFFGVYKAALETASRGKRPPVYFYQYAYKGPFSLTSKLFGFKGEEAELVGHADELLHLFDLSEVFPGTEAAIKPDTPDEEFSKNFVRLWTSFAIHGEPKHTWGNATFKKWKALSKKQLDGVYPLAWFRIQENPVSYDIDQSFKDRMQFWDDLWTHYFTPAVLALSPTPNSPDEAAANVKVEL